MTLKSNKRILFLVIGSVLFLSSCAHQPAVVVGNLPSFFSGLLHGFIMLFSLIASIFTDVRIYAFPNSGGWYDWGYTIGASIFFGGSARA